MPALSTSLLLAAALPTATVPSTMVKMVRSAGPYTTEVLPVLAALPTNTGAAAAAAAPVIETPQVQIISHEIEGQPGSRKNDYINITGGNRSVTYNIDELLSHKGISGGVPPEAELTVSKSDGELHFVWEWRGKDEDGVEWSKGESLDLPADYFSKAREQQQPQAVDEEKSTGPAAEKKRGYEPPNFPDPEGYYPNGYPDYPIVDVPPPEDPEHDQGGGQLWGPSVGDPLSDGVPNGRQWW